MGAIGKKMKKKLAKNKNSVLRFCYPIPMHSYIYEEIIAFANEGSVTIQYSEYLLLLKEPDTDSTYIA